jgi:hypothetical protein
MTLQELAKIQQRFVQALLDKLGFNSNHPRAIVFAPQYLFGIDIMDLQVEEGL